MREGMRPGKRKRGSVLLMVIGLLTVIAMLGSMLLLVARLDRQTSQALATEAPEAVVAQSILDRLLADRLADLYIDPSTNVLYGKLDPSPAVAEKQMIDYPADPCGYDQTLASIEPTGGSWRHLSNWTGAAGSLVRDVSTTDPGLVDTDGADPSDARLFPTGILDRNGGSYWAAVRMIDASGLLNVNIANANYPSVYRLAQPGRVMDAGYVALDNDALLSPGSFEGIINARNGEGPFDMSDMLALGWGGTASVTMNGRLFAAVGGTTYFLSARGSLTSVSATRGTISPLWTYMATAGSIKRDPNTLRVAPTDPNVQREVYNAALAMFQAYDPADPSAPHKAAQLTVNLIDYLDSDPNVTRIDAHDLDLGFALNSFHYGIERHPFVSKVFRKRVFVDPSTSEIGAIELINPYAERIDLTNYYVDTVQLTGKGIEPLSANKRFVIYSPSFDPANIDPSVDPSSQVQIPGLDPNVAVKIMWKDPSASWEVCIDQTPPVDCSTPTALDPSYWFAKFRDDEPNHARYTVDGDYADPSASSQQDPSADYAYAACPNKMGQPNPYRPPDGYHTPIYVRNGPMICLGDMMRILTVGPTDTVPVTARLTTDPSAGGYPLVPGGGTVPVGGTLHVPLGALAGEFFNLLPTDPCALGSIPGLVNINTAPVSVLQCLPGLIPGIVLQAPQTQALAEEIIAYRDLGAIGGRDYTVRATPTGIANLRGQAGFACAGEVAIPLRVAMNALPAINTFGAEPPEHYAVAPPGNTDDGLPRDAAKNPMDDPVKRQLLYNWMSDQVTVRSNTFIVYIRVQRDGDPKSQRYRNYVAVIDRSNCAAVGDRPRVLLFAEMR